MTDFKKMKKSSFIPSCLAIAKCIVDLHGGRIWGKDNPDG